MRASLKNTYVEWGFITLLIGLCAILSVLQYRWTGEVSRAETEHLRAGINSQAQQFGRAFDSELQESCNLLVPQDETVDDRNREAIHIQRFQKWKAIHPQPLFSRIAIAVPVADGVELFEQNQTDGKLQKLSWPADWKSLRDNLEQNGGGGPPSFRSPPYSNSSGRLIEFPIFGRPADEGRPMADGGPGPGNGPPPDGEPPLDGGHPGESEWMIFELNTNYICGSWLPELTRIYFNPDNQLLYDVEVKTIGSPQSIIYLSGADVTKNPEKPITVPFNQQGRDPEARRGPAPDFKWQLEVRTHPGALEAIVNASHRKNLAVAIFVNILILAAGLALVRHSRRSRFLAQAQMNFVANVSHELRTPLTVIRGAAHNMRRGVIREREQIEKYSGLIMEHCDQLGEMVEQVLALAGAQKTRSAALRQPVALAEVLNEAVAATMHDTQAAECLVELELPPKLPMIIGDASALRRVFQNLISNAARHGGSGKWIGITAVSVEFAKSPVIEIQVADRGPGIPADEQAEIFEPFYRGTTARTMQIRGSGLGLSLVQEIVEAHQGTISVESHPGRGTVFTIRLPAVE